MSANLVIKLNRWNQELREELKASKTRVVVLEAAIRAFRDDRDEDRDRTRTEMFELAADELLPAQSGEGE